MQPPNEPGVCDNTQNTVIHICTHHQLQDEIVKLCNGEMTVKKLMYEFGGRVSNHIGKGLFKLWNIEVNQYIHAGCGRDHIEPITEETTIDDLKIRAKSMDSHDTENVIRLNFLFGDYIDWKMEMLLKNKQKELNQLCGSIVQNTGHKYLNDNGTDMNTSTSDEDELSTLS